MYRTLEKIKQRIIFKKIENSTLERYMPTQDLVKIFADYREKGSGVIKELIELGVDLKLEKLDSSDYILSSRCAVEYKTSEDFIDSLVDGRLLSQVKNLKSSFERPIIIVEGKRDIYSIRNIHPNAIRGLLATISVSFNVPILFTKNPHDTANLLKIIAKREQDETGRDFSMHPEKRIASLKEQQEYIVSALPGVGPTLAKPLLRKFKTIKRIINAGQKSLQKVEKIGEKKASAIENVINKEYE
jgi:Fanconi anemia group M protein